MTQDEIIEMAQECGLVGMRPHLDGIYIESLLAFAKLVAEAERERIKQANAPEIEKINAYIEHAMRETQRLGQEIEQKPVETYIHEFTKLPHPGDFGIPKNHWWQAKQYADALQPKQEPVTDEIASILACRNMLDAQPVPPRENT